MAVRPKKEPIVHRDLVGRKILVGDIVAFAQGGEQYVGKITKLTPKRVKINRITQYAPNVYWRQESYQRSPDDVVIIEGVYVTAYIMKNSN